MAVMGAEQESDKIDPQNHMTKLHKDEVAEKHEAEESEKEAHAEYTVDQDIAKADNRGGSLAKDLEVKLKQGIADCMELSLATNTEVGEAFCGTIDECGLEAQKASCKIWKKDVAAWEKRMKEMESGAKQLKQLAKAMKKGKVKKEKSKAKEAFLLGTKVFHNLDAMKEINKLEKKEADFEAKAAAELKKANSPECKAKFTKVYEKAEELAEKTKEKCVEKLMKTHEFFVTVVKNAPKQDQKVKLHKVVKMLKQHEKKLKKLKKKMATKLQKVQAKKEEQIELAKDKNEEKVKGKLPGETKTADKVLVDKAHEYNDMDQAAKELKKSNAKVSHGQNTKTESDFKKATEHARNALAFTKTEVNTHLKTSADEVAAIKGTPSMYEQLTDLYQTSLQDVPSMYDQLSSLYQTSLQEEPSVVELEENKFEEEIDA
jgi:hypothetical protein